MSTSIKIKQELYLTDCMQHHCTSNTQHMWRLYTWMLTANTEAPHLKDSMQYALCGAVKGCRRPASSLDPVYGLLAMTVLVQLGHIAIIV